MNFAVLLARATGGMFFERRYLSGKWFDSRRIGWLWVLKGIWFQKILGFNRGVPVPVDPRCRISNFGNLILGKNTLNNLQNHGVYFQNYSARIHLGDNCFIGPNVGLITANHDPLDPAQTLPGRDIYIGESCWIGMNSVILPGVSLGGKTIVGAGAVVTKSFPEGRCLIGGNPARLIRVLGDE